MRIFPFYAWHGISLKSNLIVITIHWKMCVCMNTRCSCDLYNTYIYIYISLCMNIYGIRSRVVMFVQFLRTWKVQQCKRKVSRYSMHITYTIPMHDALDIPHLPCSFLHAPKIHFRTLRGSMFTVPR